MNVFGRLTHFAVVFSFFVLPARAGSPDAEPIFIPLKHVTTGGGGDPEDDNPSALGILVGIEGGAPHLFELDTGSDEFMVQIGETISGLQPTGDGPKMYAYGNSTYGYWMREVRFETLKYYDPENPSTPVATLGGGYVAGQILDWVYTRNHDDFRNLKVTRTPVGEFNGTPLYADLEIRARITAGQPSDTPPFYGTFGAANYIGDGIGTSALGGRTQTGYVVAANANVQNNATPGCVPCLVLHLTPSIRAQFTALMPWGEMNYFGLQPRFPQSGANASTQDEGSYRYTISGRVGKKKRAVELSGPILFDTGTPNYLYTDEGGVLSKLKARGVKLKQNGDDTVDFKLHGFEDQLNDLEYDEVDILRMSGEPEGSGLVVGLPFFQSNSIMYDLENRTTAYSPYFVAAGNFDTSAASDDIRHLHNIHSEMGSQGWLGLAGVISGQDDLLIGTGANVRMTGVNTYTGKTVVAPEGFLYLAGPGSLGTSSEIVVEGVFNIMQAGDYRAPLGVAASNSEVTVRGIAGKGEIYLGSRRLILTAAAGQFDGQISDANSAGESAGGGLALEGGKLTLTGVSDYAGLTEVAPGAELNISGSLAGDVSVSGSLVVTGEVKGTVTVQPGGRVSGGGKFGRLSR